MTVYIEKPSLNLREELASLRNQGGYQEQQFYFDSLVTNGTFDANITGWTDSSTGTGSISWNASGYLNLSSTDTNNRGIASQSFSTVVGKAYVITSSQVGGLSGLFRVGTSVGGSENLSQSQPTGDYVNTFVATATTTYVTIYGNPIGTTSYDNVSVFETDGTDVVHRMPKGWVPLHVYEDGLLQREGAANDYEVVYDGFDYYVKPAVAPSATTQTCVIGVRK